MGSRDRHRQAGAPEGARRATGGAPASDTPERGRFSSRRKMEVVLRLLRGEELDALSREHGVTASTICEWRDAFLEGGRGNLKHRKAESEDVELQRYKALVGDLTMRLELHQEFLKMRGISNPLA